MEKSTIDIIPKLIAKNKNIGEINFNFGPFVRTTCDNDTWTITMLAYFLSNFKSFKQPKMDSKPYMYNGILPLQKALITPIASERVALNDNSLFNLWEFNFKLEKDFACNGLHLVVDLNLIIDNVPTRGTVVMGQASD